MGMFANIEHLSANTDAVNREVATKAINDFYEFTKQKPPMIIFVAGPEELERELSSRLKLTDHNLGKYQTIYHFVTKRGMSVGDRMAGVVNQIFNPIAKKYSSNVSRYWSGSNTNTPKDYEYKDDYEWSKLASDVWDNSYFTVNYKNIVFVVDRPMEIYTNNRGFHNVVGPAITFRDGSEYYCYEGLPVKKQHLLDPQNMSLNDIHSYGRSKYLLIDLVGVEKYKEMCASWVPPQTTNRFKHFFSFNKMIVDGDEGRESWNKKGYAHRYIDKPYEVIINGSVSINRKPGVMIKNPEYSDQNYYFEGYHTNPFDTDHWNLLFDKEDKELWDALDPLELAKPELTISYQNGVFKLKTKHGRITELIPAWFRALRFRKKEAVYETPQYIATSIDGGEIMIEKKDKNFSFHKQYSNSLEHSPTTNMDVQLESNSWPDLLDQWAKFSFYLQKFM